jgi:hypothetical protein
MWLSSPSKCSYRQRCSAHLKGQRTCCSKNAKCIRAGQSWWWRANMEPLHAVFDAAFDNDDKKWVWVFQFESCRDVANSILAGSNTGFESTIRSGLSLPSFMIHAALPIHVALTCSKVIFWRGSLKRPRWATVAEGKAIRTPWRPQPQPICSFYAHLLEASTHICVKLGDLATVSGVSDHVPLWANTCCCERTRAAVSDHVLLLATSKNGRKRCMPCRCALVASRATHFPMHSATSPCARRLTRALGCFPVCSAAYSCARLLSRVLGHFSCARSLPRVIGHLPVRSATSLCARSLIRPFSQGKGGINHIWQVCRLTAELLFEQCEALSAPQVGRLKDATSGLLV